ncbi:hypothetical protein C8Q74DRAFT_1341653 [Fomes fomentarius]|nr:hypothetical protein C8Q74DRAFT_1341653 [Fomes fomentarius]
MSVYLHSSKFLDKFLPLPPSTLLDSKPASPNFTRLLGMTSEKDISKEWTAIVNKRRLCPGYKVALSEATDDPSKVNGAIYLSGQTPSDGRPLWARLRALIEFKCGEAGNDPFDDTTGNAGAQSCTANRGQDSSYPLHAFTRQQRTAVIMFLIDGTKARVTRWERGGTISTEAFDYVENPGLLRDFLWRFSLLSEEDQGLDNTAVPLKKKDNYYKLMDKLATGQHLKQAREPPDLSGDGNESTGTFAYVREKFAESLEDGWPRYRVTVPSDKGNKTFLIAKPVVHAPKMVGRGTRGYISVDVEMSRFVWLNDTWQEYYAGIEAEGEILKTLPTASVTRIPTVLQYGGDLMHRTKTHAKHVSGNKQQRQGSRMRHLSHYRLVVNEVCLPLCELNSSRQLIQTTLDATETHKQAVTKAHILHGDISVGNVLPTIVEKDGQQVVEWRRGNLADSELYKVIPERGTKTTHHLSGRNGTWQFDSVALLLWGLPPGIADEIESLFHLVLYIGIRYLRNSVVEVEWFLMEYFESSTIINNAYRCGTKKQDAMSNGALWHNGTTVKFFRSSSSSAMHFPDHPLNRFITKMLEVIKARYQVLSYQRRLLLWRRQFAKKMETQQHKLLPPPQVDEAAQKLDTHEFVMSLLSDILTEEDWPVADFVGDQATSSNVASPTDNDSDHDDYLDGDRDDEESRPSKRARKSSSEE